MSLRIIIIFLEFLNTFDNTVPARNNKCFHGLWYKSIINFLLILDSRSLVGHSHNTDIILQDCIDEVSWWALSVQFSLVTQSCSTLCDPMNRSTPGLPVHHQLPEFTQTHVHQVSDAIHPSHPLSSPSPPVLNPSQHQSIFQWVNSSHEVAKVLEFQL